MASDAPARPFGVKVLAWTMGGYGVSLMLIVPFIGKASGVGLGALTFASAGLVLVGARGLWLQRTWAWWLAILIAIFAVAVDSAGLVLRRSPAGAPLRIGIDVVVVAYLIHVRERFRPAEPD